MLSKKFIIRTILIFNVFLSLTGQLAAQDPVFSHFMFNQLCFNPAFAGNSPYPRLILGYRNQWPEFGNAYVTYYASYDQYVEWLNGGLGINIARDVQGNGAFSKSSAELMYNFPFELNKEIIANLGIQAGIVQKRISGSGLIFPDQNPYQPPTQQEIVHNQGKLYPDFAAGASFYIREQYQVNFSVHHLNTPNEMIGSGRKYFSPLRYTVQLLGKFAAHRNNRSESEKVFQPGIMAQIQKNSTFLGWGGNVLFSSLMGGLWFRNNLSFNLNSFIFLLGYSNSGISLVYSYDLWAPQNNRGLKIYGAHEVTFQYLFKYNDPKKKMRTIKCPKFY